MGLLNVSHSTMTQSVIDLQEDLLKNPFYLFNDKKALPVDYYNINNNQSTLDKGLKINYDNDGKDTPFRYNLIHDMYLYGIDRVATSLESGEFGISGSEISGDAYILPDTITPYPGDHFVINMIKQRYQFIVSSVSTDTFDNGGNYYKIEYSLIHNEYSILEQAEYFNRRHLPEHELKTILNRYLFPAATWNKSCRLLSGGEKMRLSFCCLMIADNTPDVFILDEPTNNLDIESIEIITATIRDYTGTVIAISHDKEFLKEINCKSWIKLESK